MPLGLCSYSITQTHTNSVPTKITIRQSPAMNHAYLHHSNVTLSYAYISMTHAHIHTSIHPHIHTSTWPVPLVDLPLTLFKARLRDTRKCWWPAWTQELFLPFRLTRDTLCHRSITQFDPPPFPLPPHPHPRHVFARTESINVVIFTTFLYPCFTSHFRRSQGNSADGDEQVNQSLGPGPPENLLASFIFSFTLTDHRTREWSLWTGREWNASSCELTCSMVRGSTNTGQLPKNG